jgi:hypothetical protein
MPIRLSPADTKETLVRVELMLPLSQAFVSNLETAPARSSTRAPRCLPTRRAAPQGTMAGALLGPDVGLLSDKPPAAEGGAPYVAFGVRTVFVRCLVRCLVRCSVRASRDVRCDVKTWDFQIQFSTPKFV